MPTYTPNAFAAGTAGQSQSAQANALRSYAPNQFTGTNTQAVTSMAPHLSVPEAERPFASDIALIRGSEYANLLPNMPSSEQLDTAWRFSPQTYQQRLSDVLRTGDAGLVLGELKKSKEPNDIEMSFKRKRFPGSGGEDGGDDGDGDGDE